MTALCRLDGVHMDYGREQVLRGVDLVIDRGTIVGLIGKNGSGKSTLLRILAGVLRPDRGTLIAAHRPRIGYMPESSRWYPYLTGAQVLDYFARQVAAPAAATERLLARVGLAPARHKKVAAYSKGMRQKLGLAQALLGDPELLVLDEPTNGLDPPAILDFYEILRARAAAGTAVILSSHLLAEMEGRTTHVAFLRDGRIAASGAGDDLVRAAGLPSRVRLRLAGPSPRLQAWLDQAGWEVTRRGDDEVRVRLGRQEVSRLLAELAPLLNGEVDLDVRHPSLEDLYLHVLGARPGARPDQGMPQPLRREKST